MEYLVPDVEIFVRHASSEGRENTTLEPLDYGISPDHEVDFNKRDWELARIFTLDLSSRVQAEFP